MAGHESLKADQLEARADAALEALEDDPNVHHTLLLKSKIDEEGYAIGGMKGVPLTSKYDNIAQVRDESLQISQELRAFIQAGSSLFAVTRIETASNSFHALSLVGEEGQGAELIGYLGGPRAQESMQVGRAYHGPDGVGEDGMLSRSHFEVAVADEESGLIIIGDSGSSNGTTVGFGSSELGSEFSQDVSGETNDTPQDTAEFSVGGLRAAIRKRLMGEEEPQEQTPALSETERWVLPAGTILDQSDRVSYHKDTNRSSGLGFSEG